MGRAKRRRPAPGPQRWELKLDELQAVLERARAAPLGAEDFQKLKAAIETLAFLTAEIAAKRASIARLRQMLFGAKTEKTEKVLGRSAGGGAAGGDDRGECRAAVEQKPKQPGHGRLGSAAYLGAERVRLKHPTLQGGDPCPGCLKGKVYPLAEPSVLVRISGMAPLGACVYERERLRCNLCGEVFCAPAPEGVGEEKYDETASAMVGLLKYGCGLPFNRIEKLQAGLGIPLPAATQWELVRDAAELLLPVYQQLVRQAAQGQVLYNDDTTMKILELTREQRRAAAADEQTDERTGVFTSGIVSVREGQKAALFFTGVRHAGENLARVLAERAQQLPPPIQMCDMLSRNTPGEFKTVLGGCLAHSRRKYVEVADNFPDEVQHVLDTLRQVYQNDACCRQRGMGAAERLRFHQENSGPLMKDLEAWLRQQFDERRVEPNSSLGEAIVFMLKHFDRLTLFLREPGAPLDSNIVERALKKAILHRKNAYFYKTTNGARVGDVFMSLIHTAELNGANTFDYLVAVLRHADAVANNPAQWMPWNYTASLAHAGPPP